MEEQKVMVDGVISADPPSFIIMATQNPIECERTVPLPEAQFG